ncbi:hypothetical protein [Pedobacter sp. MW01-1-1]|uniref:hypothetical protein n=1 Tax=Pedobacter sp. MW01-1-1 TaxID=3383027 RepID=UPI003FEEE239
MVKVKSVILFAISCLFGSALFAQNIFPSTGNVGLGTLLPGAKLSFNDVNDGTDTSDGITWFSPNPLAYGIFRTPGPWTPPNYQQLKISWDTGIILDPGNTYNKSYVDVKGSGLRVTSGKLGVGTLNPLQALDVRGIVRWGDEDSYIYSGQDNLGGYFEQNSTFPNRNVMRLQANKNGNYSGYAQFFIDAEKGFSFRTLGNANGNVGIGISAPTEKLAVNGNIRAKEIKVESNNWPDYVFEKEYNLLSLTELENYVKTHKHLPEVPSQKEVQENGLALGEMNKALLKKVEELTLHLIEKDKEIAKLKQADEVKSEAISKILDRLQKVDQKKDK